MFLLNTAVADREVDHWLFSRKGKLGGSDVFIGRRGGITPLIFLKLQESWSKVGHAAMTTVYSVTFFISSTILLLIVVGQIDRTPPLHGKFLVTSLL